jgi:hypothetical protein
MWSWLFPPRCPIGTEEKVWVESRMTWLAQQFGVERMLKAQVIEPTDEYFPEAYHGTEEDAQRMFRKLLGFLDIDPGSVPLLVRHDWDHNSPLGEYQQGERPQILLNPSQLEDPESLLGTLAHELAHHLLLGGGLLQNNNEDLERLTDLLPIYFGLGIFGANSVVREKTIREGRHSEWSIHKQGYLPMRMHAYGLAVFAYVRQEWKPTWARHLRPDISEPLYGALRYLRDSADCTFQSHPPAGDLPLASIEECLSKLRDKSASKRYLALCDLLEHGPAAAAAVLAVSDLLHDADQDIVITAARALGEIGPAAILTESELRGMLENRNALVRIQAAYSLAAIGARDTATVRELIRSLDDDDPGVIAAAAHALGQCAPGDESVARQLLPRYRVALIKWDDRLIRSVALALHKTAGDAAALVRENFGESDAEFLGYAEEGLAEALKEPVAETE